MLYNSSTSSVRYLMFYWVKKKSCHGNILFLQRVHTISHDLVASPSSINQKYYNPCGVLPLHCVSVSTLLPATHSSWSVSLHVLKPAAYSLETPHPSPSLLPARQHQPVTHAHSRTRTRTEATSAPTLSLQCVCVCVSEVSGSPPHLEQCSYSASSMRDLLCFWFLLVQPVWAGDAGVAGDTNSAVFPQDCSLDCIRQVGSVCARVQAALLLSFLCFFGALTPV